MPWLRYDLEAMAKRTDQSPAEAGRSFGVGRLERHLFVCLGPDCADLADGERTWVYLKTRMKELNITGPDGPFYRTKCQCLRICTERTDLRRLPRGRVVPECDAGERGAHHPGTPHRRTDCR